MIEQCPVSWGSHGCDKPRGHDGVHKCEDACSEFEVTGPIVEENYADIPGRTRYSYDDDGTDWSDWLDSSLGFWVGT